MYITFDELLQLKEMSLAKYSAGGSGDYRIIVWYALSEIMDYRTSDYDRKIIFVAGVGMKEYEKELLEIVQHAIANNAAGIVVEIGPYIPQVPKEVAELANAQNFPVITLPFDVKISSVTYALTKLFYSKNNYFQGMQLIASQILSGEIRDGSESISKAEFYGYNQELSYVIAVAKSDGADSFDELNELFLSIIEKFRQNSVTNWLAKEDTRRIVFFFPIKNSQKENVRDAILKIFPSCTGKNYSVGVSSKFNSFSEAEQCFREACEALNMIKNCNKCNEIRFFEDTGIYRILSDFSEKGMLEDIANRILEPLIAYDRDNNTKLVNTLGVFLDSNCNYTITADEINAHRNTVKYRIERIREMLEVDFSDYNQCFNLRMAYKIRKYCKK